MHFLAVDGYRAMSLAGERTDPAYLAYLADHKAWESESKERTRVLLLNLAINRDNAVAQARYNAAEASYQQAVQSYVGAMQARAAANQTTSARVAKQYGLALPVDYAGCVPQSYHDSAVNDCTAQQTYSQVRGLSGPPSWQVPCARAALPVCQPDPPRPAPPPAPQVMPRWPVPPLRPEPRPPAPPRVSLPTVQTPVTDVPVSTTPAVPTPGATLTAAVATPPTPTPDTPVQQAPLPRQAGIGMSGLILVGAAVGGFLLYRSLKPKKASA